MIAILFLVIIILLIIILTKQTPKNQATPKPTFNKATIMFSDEDLIAWQDAYVAIDFETAMPARNSACALGFVVFNKTEVLRQFYILIQPPDNEYSFYNTRVHGLGPDDTKNDPTFDKFYPRLAKLLKDKKIVAHNASFDLDVFKKSAWYYGIEPIELNLYLDTYKYFRLKLSDCCAEHNITLEHHNALSDATACANLAMIAIKEMDVYTADFNIKLEKSIEKKKARQDRLLSLPVLERVFDKSNPFFNQKVVVTGTFINFHPRKLLTDLLIELGATIQTTIALNTNIFIVGDDPGPSKIKKAEQNLISSSDFKIINEYSLLEMLNGILLEEYEDENRLHFKQISIEKGKFFYISGTRAGRLNKS